MKDYVANNNTNCNSNSKIIGLIIIIKCIFQGLIIIIIIAYIYTPYYSIGRDHCFYKWHDGNG